MSTTLTGVGNNLGRRMNFVVGLFVLALGYVATIYAVQFLLK